jgi:hypothetical protein
LEQGIFQKYASFFEEVFGIRPILRQKKNMATKQALHKNA